MVTGEEAKAGIDGPWRVHVRVKNGDLVLFTDSTVVFENGLDEQNKVWEVSEFLNGTKGKVGPLTDLLHKSFYLNPGKAMVTAEPPLGAGQPMFLIRVKNLKAGQPVLFASGKVSHVPKAHGNKHFMFGALVLDPRAEDLVRHPGRATDPQALSRLAAALEEATRKAAERDDPAVAVVAPDVRRAVAAIALRHAPGLAVLSYRELDPSVRFVSRGLIAF